MHHPDFVVRVDIPALDSLVEYLKEREINQATVNTLAEAITTITGRLLDSSKRLKSAIETAR